ncbi:hypothetical protein, partial [Brevundimonas sp.]|uniref:hypothetical protein n=1 Tax=Brevundimonas sp. TaxID=1871086 RepID=UPI0025BA5230
CSIESRADHRHDALTMIACRTGPEFLKQCSMCGGYWRETLRFDQWINREVATDMFGPPF